ncbi:MAG: hypothetical protein M3Z46_03510 [Actinomycetota bacterium]|nr:hypothetical protein [Actinomycetota bacterium]
MGQPIAVVEKASSNPGVVRFETNRALTGMGHERYRSLADTVGTRPPDVLARRLFERGGVEAVHINGNIVTVDLAKGYTSTGLKELIEHLYLFYGPQPEAPEPQHPVDAELEAGAGAAPEATTDPGAMAAPEVSAQEAPGRGGEDEPAPTVGLEVTDAPEVDAAPDTVDSIRDLEPGAAPALPLPPPPSPTDGGDPPP